MDASLPKKRLKYAAQQWLDESPLCWIWTLITSQMAMYCQEVGTFFTLADETQKSVLSSDN